MKAFLPLVNIPPQEHEALVAVARECLADCRAQAHDGTVLFRPDGSGHYDAMWTRDLCYALEGAGSLMDMKEALGAIDYLLAGQRDDGAIPDRRQADGRSVYLAGPPDRPLGEDCPTDNASFMVKLLSAYVRHSGDIHAFLQRREALYRAMDTIPLSNDGLVFIDRNRLRPEYGFTDCIAKTGNVFFTTALYWEACGTLATLCARAEYHDDAHEWYERAERTWRRIGDFWDEEEGLYWAASEWGRLPDLWGSLYACVIRVASKSRAARVAERFLGNADRAILRGHLRHLPAGVYWPRLLGDVPRDTYQNGGYWAVPSGWLAQTLQLADEGAARRLISELVVEFTAHGAHEWITPTERRLPGYVASIANVLGAVQPSGKLA